MRGRCPSRILLGTVHPRGRTPPARRPLGRPRSFAGRRPLPRGPGPAHPRGRTPPARRPLGRPRSFAGRRPLPRGPGPARPRGRTPPTGRLLGGIERLTGRGTFPRRRCPAIATAVCGSSRPGAGRPGAGTLVLRRLPTPLPGHRRPPAPRRRFGLLIHRKGRVRGLAFRIHSWLPGLRPGRDRPAAPRESGPAEAGPRCFSDRNRRETCA